MDELTLLAVAEVIKAEAGVTDHRIINPSHEDGFLGLAFPQRKNAQGGKDTEDIMKLAPRNGSEGFLCQDADHIHLRMVRCTRRTFLGGLASLGAGALFADQSASAEAAVDKPFRIDVHHHLSSPGFIAEISGRRTGTARCSRSACRWGVR